MSRRYILALSFVGAALCASGRLWLADLHAGQPLPDQAILSLGSADLQHGGRVDGLVVLDGGKRVATLGEHRLSVWDIETGRLTSSYTFSPWPEAYPRANSPYPAGGGLTALADDTALVAVRAGVATLHKLPLGSALPVPLPAPPAADDNIVAVAPSAKKDTVLGVTAKAALLEWTLGGDRWTARKSPLTTPSFNQNLALAGGGGVVAILDGDSAVRLSAVRLWDTAKGKPIAAHEGEPFRTVAVATDGKRFVTVSLFGTRAEVRTVADRTAVAGWKVPIRASSVALSADGTMAAVGYSSSAARGRNCVDLYDVATGTRQHTLAVPLGVHRLVFLPDGALVTADGAGFVQVWNTALGKPRHLPNGHTRGVRHILYRPGGGWLTAGDDGAVIAWDASGKEVRRFEGHSGRVTGLVLSTAGTTLYSAGIDRTIRAWAASSGKEQKRYTVEQVATQAVHSLALSADGKRLAAGMSKGEVWLLDARELKDVKVLEAKTGVTTTGMHSVTFASDERFVTYDNSGTVRVWDTSKGELDARRVAFSLRASSTQLAVSSDGKSVALPVNREGLEPVEELTAWATEVGMWDIATGKSQGRLKPDASTEVTAITYLPDGKAIAVGDAAGAVRVIDLATKKVRQTFAGHRGPVLCLAAAPDGRSLASGGADTTVLVWKLDPP